MPQHEHNEIMRSIGRIEGKIDGILSEAKKTNSRMTTAEQEINKIKVSDGVQNTKLGVIGTVAGTIGGAIATAFLKFF